jgi:putative oxidoreductase
VPFVRFIGTAELLGAIGLILPALTRIAPVLTPAAASGLVVVMLSAIVFHATRKEYRQIGGNILLLLLAAFVVYGRLALAPIVG